MIWTHFYIAESLVCVAMKIISPDCFQIEPGAAVAGDPSVIVASASIQPPPSSKSETPGSNPAGSASLGAVGGRLSEVSHP